jgi:tetratricopeptide (TPR) repeat protein
MIHKDHHTAITSSNLLSYGTARHMKGDLSTAKSAYIKVIKNDPKNIVALQLLGTLFLQQGHLSEAQALLSKAIEYDPTYVDAYQNRAVLFKKIGKYDQAVGDLEIVLTLNPNAIAHFNYANLLSHMGHFDRALIEYDAAIWLDPENENFFTNKCHLLLKMGHFESGWKLYERRWRRKNLALKKRHFDKPKLTQQSLLQDVKGKKIFLHWEQGFGDTIQFCRFASLLSNLGAEIILEVQKPLFELMKSLCGVSNLISNGDKIPPFDFFSPLMSLPFVLNTNLSSIPASKFYLQSQPEKQAKWGRLLGQCNKPRIGIVWSGSASHKNDQNRSMSLSSILKGIPTEYEIISLQKEVKNDDIKYLMKMPEIKHFGNELIDFSDTAALIEHIDAVVSVDTSVAHLAGALGKPVHLLLSHEIDFRWLVGRSDSPWYPSMKIYRKNLNNNWSEVLQKVMEELQFLSKKKS